MDSAARSIVIGPLAEILTACSVSMTVIGEVDSGASEVISTVLFLSFACALVSTMSFLTRGPTGRAKSVGSAQISRPGAPGRGDVRQRVTSFFWMRCGCARACQHGLLCVEMMMRLG
ncbi:unnamed protein product [Prunus armeniaca]